MLEYGFWNMLLKSSSQYFIPRIYISLHLFPMLRKMLSSKPLPFLWKRSTQIVIYVKIRKTKKNETAMFNDHLDGKQLTNGFVKDRSLYTTSVRLFTGLQVTSGDRSLFFGLQSSLVWTNSTANSSCCNGRCSLIGNLIWRSARKLLPLSR